MITSDKEFLNQLSKDYSDDSDKPLLIPQNNREYWLFTEIYTRCENYFNSNYNTSTKKELKDLNEIFIKIYEYKVLNKRYKITLGDNVIVVNGDYKGSVGVVIDSWITKDKAKTDEIYFCTFNETTYKIYILETDTNLLIHGENNLIKISKDNVISQETIKTILEDKL